MEIIKIYKRGCNVEIEITDIISNKIISYFEDSSNVFLQFNPANFTINITIKTNTHFVTDNISLVDCFYFNASGFDILIKNELDFIVNYTDVFACATGGGGGGSITADNGLTANSPTNVELGGTLIKTTTILTNAYDLTIERQANGRTLNVVNSSNGVGANKTALYSKSTDGNAGEFQAGATLIANNDVQNIVKIRRTTTNPASPNYNEIGGSLDFINPAVTGPISPAIPYTNRIASRWQNSVSSPTISQFALSRLEFFGFDNGTKRNLAIIGNGSLIFDQYGIGSHSGTLAYLLGVDASGNVIETTASGGGITGSGVATRVAFWDSANSLSSNSQLYWDNITNNLGIGGTGINGAKLNVYGTNKYASFGTTAGNNAFGIILGEAASSYIELCDSSGTRQLLINNGTGGFAPFTAYNSNTILFTYSNAVGGVNLPIDLTHFKSQFVYTTGTNVHNQILLQPEILTSGGTNTLRGIYFNPLVTNDIGTTQIAFESTLGNIKFANADNIEFNTNNVGGNNYFKFDENGFFTGTYGTGNEGLYINLQSNIFGIGDYLNNSQGNFLCVDNQNNSIYTKLNNLFTGLFLLDTGSGHIHTLGDYTNSENGTKLVVSDYTNEIYSEWGGSLRGFNFDFSAGIYKIGNYDGGDLNLVIDVTSQHLYDSLGKLNLNYASDLYVFDSYASDRTNKRIDIGFGTDIGINLNIDVSNPLNNFYLFGSCFNSGILLTIDNSALTYSLTNDVGGFAHYIDWADAINYLGFYGVSTYDLFLTINANNGQVQFLFNGVNCGLEMDFVNLIYYFGGTSSEGVSGIKIDDNTRIVTIGDSTGNGNGNHIEVNDSVETIKFKTSNGIYNFANVQAYTDNADALANGLVIGDIYRHSNGDIDQLNIVH
jgi:hypothetical protein